jgi:bacterioferritin-associated ferredoxin
MDKFYQDLFGVLTTTRARPANRESKAASLQPQTVTISLQEYEGLLKQDGKCANTIRQTIRKSRAASLQTSGKGINQAQVIHNFITR